MLKKQQQQQRTWLHLWSSRGSGSSHKGPGVLLRGKLLELGCWEFIYLALALVPGSVQEEEKNNDQG